MDTPGDDQGQRPRASRRQADRRRDGAYERFLADVDLALCARGWLHASVTMGSKSRQAWVLLVSSATEEGVLVNE